MFDHLRVLLLAEDATHAHVEPQRKPAEGLEEFRRQRLQLGGQTGAGRTQSSNVHLVLFVSTDDGMVQDVNGLAGFSEIYRGEGQLPLDLVDLVVGVHCI